MKRLFNYSLLLGLLFAVISSFVYLQLDEEGYKKQEVTLGASNGKEVQILTGLKAGDRVVTKGAYQVKLASASNAIPAHSHEH